MDQAEGEPMMPIVSRLIGISVFGSIVLVAIALTGLLAVFTLLDQMGDLDQRYTFWAALLYVGLSVPRLFYETLPYAILIGALISLGGFAVRSELVAMRAAGMSVYKILSYAMLPALLVAGGGVFVGEYVLPDAERMARLERRQATSIADAIAPEYGIWLRDGDAFIHAELIHENTLLDLRWLIFDEGKRLTKVRTAESAEYVPGGDGVESYWELSQVEEVTYGEDRSVRGLGLRSTWETELTPDEISSELLVEPSRMSISALSKKITVLERQSLEVGKYQLGFWAKVLQPLTALALLALSAAMVFGPLRDASMGFRIFTGLLLGVGFKFLQDLLAPMALVYGIPPLVAVILPTALCLWLAFYQLRRLA